MNVSDAIHTRRAYRSLERVEITREIVEDLARHAQLSASCFNNQPWRYVFVYERDKLEEMYEALSRGNAWAKQASMIIVAFSKPDDDCQIRDRERIDGFQYVAHCQAAFQDHIANEPSQHGPGGRRY